MRSPTNSSEFLEESASSFIVNQREWLEQSAAIVDEKIAQWKERAHPHPRGDAESEEDDKKTPDESKKLAEWTELEREEKQRFVSLLYLESDFYGNLRDSIQNEVQNVVSDEEFQRFVRETTFPSTRMGSGSEPPKLLLHTPFNERFQLLLVSQLLNGVSKTPDIMRCTGEAFGRSYTHSGIHDLVTKLDPEIGAECVNDEHIDVSISSEPIANDDNDSVNTDHRHDDTSRSRQVENEFQKPSHTNDMTHYGAMLMLAKVAHAWSFAQQEVDRLLDYIQENVVVGHTAMADHVPIVREGMRKLLANAKLQLSQTFQQCESRPQFSGDFDSNCDERLLLTYMKYMMISQPTKIYSEDKPKCQRICINSCHNLEVRLCARLFTCS